MGVRLPAEYQEVEYLEATGTQAFFTDVPIQDGLTVDSVQTFSGGDTYLFGGHNGKGLQASFNGYYSSNLQSSYSGYYMWGNPINANNTTIHHIVLTQQNGSQIGIKNGVQVLSGTRTTSGDTSAGDTAAMFGQRGSNGSLGLFYKGKVYSCKVSKGNELLADYVPCYRKSDGEIGMFDLVLQKFYANEGTGVFLKGADVIDSISPLMVAWRRAMMSQMQPRLPIAYQEVPFIIGQGTQYIDTGYVLNSECRVQGRYDLYESTKLGSVVALFGARDSNYNNAFAMFNVTAAPRIDYGKTLTTHSFYYVTINNRSVVDFDLNAGIATVNGRTYAFADSLKPFTCPSTALIFAAHTENTVDTRRPKGEIVYLKITDENGIVVRDMIPCYRKADNKPGMYDLANNQFYTNAGTGEFQLPS